jgi:hypothetical protein
MGNFTVIKKSVNQVEYQGKTYTCDGERIVIDGQSRWLYRTKRGLDCDILICDDGYADEPVFTHLTKLPGGCYTVPSEETNEYEYVDLGLPSGTMWATENIKDANGNELYFAWGETQGYTAEQVGNEEGERAFTWNDYKFGTYEVGEEGPIFNFTKYNQTDGKTELDAEDDAAVVNLGNGWRMPTIQEFEELKANTEYEWTEVNGVQGAKLTSTIEGHTDKFLFLPTVGIAYDGGIFKGVGNYLSASLNVPGNLQSSLCLDFGETGYGQYNTVDRCAGCSVRPVRA